MKLQCTFALLALVGLQTTAFAYRYTFSNHTNRPIKIEFQLSGDGEIWEQELQPDETWEQWFKWLHETKTQEEREDWENIRRAGFCIGSIKIQAWKRLRSGRMGFGAWKEVNVVYIESNAYDILINAADKFINGVISAATAAANVITGAQAASQAVSAVKGVARTAAKPTSSEFRIEKLGIIKSIGDFIIYSKCRNRHYDIIHDEGDIWVTTLAE